MSSELPTLYPERKESFEYELTPSGTHVATIFKLVNLGHIPTKWNDEEKIVHKVRIFWELPEETKTFKDKDGNEQTLPFAISKKLTLSMGDKSNLLPLVKGMTGLSFANEEEAHGFNFFSLLGHSCLINVIHEKSSDGQRTYSVVNSASVLPKSMTAPSPVNEQVIWNVSTMSQEEIGQLPAYIRDDMEASSEYRVRFLEKHAQPAQNEETINPDDIPF